eukprot:TRINITY_DN3229_c0_g1_i3.p1 TRINITY_DN3229_c0_g1~~TRINITY_DN3229_c0_g1_i3.p1  ORF type:complete len:165 (+),score=17.02 TRINITY_DN3229_c0_g1_i3:74-496(+)
MCIRDRKERVQRHLTGQQRSHTQRNRVALNQFKNKQNNSIRIIFSHKRNKVNAIKETDYRTKSICRAIKGLSRLRFAVYAIILIWLGVVVLVSSFVHVYILLLCIYIFADFRQVAIDPLGGRAITHGLTAPLLAHSLSVT